MKVNDSVTLRELHTEMRACRLCVDADYDVTPPAVVAGSPGAKIMTIGQAPGVTEVEAGRPFNAGSGQRLFKWLEGAEIEEKWFRTTQYMTAVTKCYPGRAKGGSGDRVPSRAEQKLCCPYLEREIALINPDLIIPIGKLAIELFYPKGLKLTEIIGTEKEESGRWIVPLPHSSGASRWHQISENRELIQKAIGFIDAHVMQLFPN
ncbi:uracil-DNA glycosylase family protein [Chloroflexota bacterium]